MFKNLIKKVKSFAKKAAPYAGLVAGAFGMNPMAAAGIGALLGGMGGGGMKGAMMGGLGGYMGGKMFGQNNPLFAFQKGSILPQYQSGAFANMPSLIGEGGNILNTTPVDAAGKARKMGMMDYLPLIGLGTGLAYAGGLFDEPPIPEDAIPKEYKYDPDKDPLKNINQKFANIYGNYSPVPATSIYGYLDSMGLGGFGNKDGGVMSFADGNPTNVNIDISDLDDNQLEIYNGLLDIGYEADEALQLIFDPGPQFLRRRRVLRGLAPGGSTRDDNPAMEQLIVPNPNLPSSQGIMEESGILSLEELEMYIEQLTMMKNAGELSEEQFQMAVQMVMKKAGQMKAAEGGIAQFNFGGEIMGPGTGREDIIPGKIVDRNTGQTSDMLVSNNEHIIPEYTLYAMGGGDTEKGHEMMNKLRSETKSIASKMGYDFKGAEDGSVRYG